MKRNTCGKSSLSAIMFLAFLFTIHLVVLPIPAQESSYVPVDNYDLECGSSPTSLWDDTRRWSVHNGSKFESSIHESRPSIQDPENHKNPKILACIYLSRYTHTFSVSPGPKFIRLHFYLTSYSGLHISKALFSVSIGGYTILQTSKSSYSKDASNVKYAIREFCVQVHGHILNLTFTPSNYLDSYAFVNKIEIVSMPTNLYLRRDVRLPLIGDPSQYFVANSAALETMYRLNVGGHSISAEDDTGMFRIWSGDEDYLSADAIRTEVVHSKVNIRYSSLLPGYTAPVKVYATARTGTFYVRNPIVWLLPVDSAFSYLVRLHFCEIEWEITHENQRVFHVYINNHTAEDHADVIHWSNGTGVPVYRDYVVNFSGHSQGIQNLLVAMKSDIGYYNPILNGLEIFKLSDANNNLAGPYPFGSRIQRNEASRIEDFPKLLLILRAVLFGLVLLCLVSLFFFYFSIGRWCPSLLVSCSRSRPFMLHLQSSDHCRYFSFAEVKSATSNFSDSFLIGAGGFGEVYKGNIDGGVIKVAIKRGNPTSHQGLHEFQTEITMLSKFRHSHLVSLIGYCMEDKEMILVYDYMAKGTLRDHLYNTQKPPLPWKQRLKICIGAARGLHYLHTCAKHPIIHRDVKTTNILLDERWVAKVSDFGLSKFGPNMMTQSHTHVSTAVKGSFGYLDPEYYRRRKLTEKSDVYSFGVVLFEVLCARPAVVPMAEEEEHEQVNLAEWVIHCCQNGTLDRIVDPYLRGKIDPECFKTFTEIGKKCLGDRGNERPSMGDVLWNLELAWQQQSAAECEEERVGGDVAVVIDGQRSLCVGHSDPTPGVEFSDILFPMGR